MERDRFVAGKSFSSVSDLGAGGRRVTLVARRSITSEAWTSFVAMDVLAKAVRVLNFTRKRAALR